MHLGFEINKLEFVNLSCCLDLRLRRLKNYMEWFWCQSCRDKIFNWDFCNWWSWCYSKFLEDGNHV